VNFLAIHPGASYSTADVFTGLTNALREQGHTVWQFNLDVRLGWQTQWLKFAWRKAGKPPDGKPQFHEAQWHSQFPLAMWAAWNRPDWVLLFSGQLLHPNLLPLLRKIRCERCCHFKTAFVFTESPYDDEPGQAALAQQVDVCFTNERSSVPILRRFNPATFYLPAAYDPAKHRPSEPDPDVPAHDVVFVGTYFEERTELFSRVNWDGIDVGLYGFHTLVPSRSRIRKYIKGDIVPNTRTAALYRAARIGLNPHRVSEALERHARRITRAESLNPRAYELAATGCFQLTDARPEVAEVFGDAVPTYRDAAELEALIRYYLAHDGERRALAARARQAVQGHTFAARAETLVQELVRLDKAA
jgi:spore maturation protein CgeB